MRSHTKDLYLITMYLLALAGIVMMIASGIETLWLTFLISAGWLLSFSIRNLLLYNTDSYRKWAFVTYLLEITLMLGLGLMGAGDAVIMLLYLTLADCCIAWGIGYGAICQVVILMTIAVKYMSGADPDYKVVLLEVLRQIPMLMLVTLVSFLVGRVMKGSVQLEKSVNDVQEREAKLSVAYHQLRDAYKKLEEMATLKERNRIAREIHDTVGHTLTTVIIDLEAGKMLAAKDPSTSRKKYEMAQEQAIKALNEMRRSVRMLKDDQYVKDLKQAFCDVLEEVTKHGDITVRHSIELPDGLKTQCDELLIRALKEGISNGIRHGKGTAFFLKVIIKDDKLYFLLQDNGEGCDSIEYGFGLENMRNGVESAGGVINFTTSPGEGFDIEIVLPVK